MTNQGPYPDRKSVNTFLSYARGNKNVRRADLVGPYLVRVERNHGGDVIVKLVDIYVVSETDVMELLAENPGINAIVTTSGWNSYTPTARALARSSDVGLFTFKEFFGAVHRVGDAFVSFGMGSSTAG